MIKGMWVKGMRLEMINTKREPAETWGLIRLVTPG